MNLLQNFTTETLANVAIGLGTEFGGEFAAEWLVNSVFGRRGQSADIKQELLDLINAGDKRGLTTKITAIKANQLGIGQADEQIMENDLTALYVANMVTAAEFAAVEDFFFSRGPHCLTEREQNKYRQGHVLEADVHIRRRNLRLIAQLPDHAARRRHLGTTGKLNRNFGEKAYDRSTGYLTENTAQTRAELRRETRLLRTARAEATRPRGNFLRRFFGLD